MPPPITHLIVLMMETRSFDHMFGYIDPDDDIDDLSDTEFNNRATCRRRVLIGCVIPRDSRKKLDKENLEAPARPQKIGSGPLSEHQTSQVMSAHRLDQLLPPEKRVIGSTPEFKTLQDIWTEQRAIEYIRLVSKRAKAQWAQP